MLGQKGIELRVGDKIHYRNCESMIHPEATYEGVVTEIHPTYYRVYGTPIRNTMHETKNAFWGSAIPYFFCIPKYIDGAIERFSVVDKLTEINTQLIIGQHPEFEKYFEVAEQLSA